MFEAGIVALAGRTDDARPWPESWQAEAGALVAIRAAAPWLRLPTPTQLRTTRARAALAIGEWLGDEAAIRGRRGVIRAEPPATPDEIAAFAIRESFALPEGYRSLLAVADGIEIKSIVVLGTRDAYRLDMPGPPRLVIVSPNEDGATTLAEGGEVVVVPIGDARADGRFVAADLRAWLRSRLALRPDQPPPGSPGAASGSVAGRRPVRPCRRPPRRVRRSRDDAGDRPLVVRGGRDVGRRGLRRLRLGRPDEPVLDLRQQRHQVPGPHSGSATPRCGSRSAP